MEQTPADPASLEFRFFERPWENARMPTIVRDDPWGGDPHILATIVRVHDPDGLYELCRLANIGLAVERAKCEGSA